MVIPVISYKRHMEPEEECTVFVVFRKSLKRHGFKQRLVLGIHVTVKNSHSRGIKIPSFIHLCSSNSCSYSNAALLVNIIFKTPRRRL